MFSNFFSEFLVNEQYLPREALKKARIMQRRALVNISGRALKACYMTPEEVQQVLSLQTRIDKPFGELAVLHGNLSEDQLHELLFKQCRGFLLFKDALVDMQILSVTEFEKALMHYKEATGMSDAAFECFQHDGVREAVDFLLNINGSEDTRLYREAFVCFMQNIMHCIDTAVRFDPACEVRDHPFEFLACQEIKGDQHMFTGFCGTNAGMCGFAGRFAGRRLTKLNELGRDAVGEFMNYCNGHLLGIIADKNPDITLTPQRIFEHGTISSRGCMYTIPVHLPFGSFEFIAADMCIINPCV